MSRVYYSEVFLIQPGIPQKQKQFISLKYLMWGWYNWNNLKEEKIFKSCYSLKGFQLSDSTSSLRFYLVKI